MPRISENRARHSVRPTDHIAAAPVGRAMDAEVLVVPDCPHEQPALELFSGACSTTPDTRTRSVSLSFERWKRPPGADSAARPRSSSTELTSSWRLVPIQRSHAGSTQPEMGCADCPLGMT